MKIASMKIHNFRGYNKEIEVMFEDLTVIVGKNDVGKSTVLEALDIFFNDGKGAVKFDKSDINNCGLAECNTEVSISVCFVDLPKSIIIDTSVSTSFESEYLLNDAGQLEIIKRYSNSGNPKIYIKAKHPQNIKCSELLLKKNSELKKMINEESIECENLNINAVMRKALWEKYQDNLQLEECEIDVSKEDAKRIWENIASYLPIYSLFQSDRKNSDTDSEVQDPLKEAVKQIINDESLREKLKDIADTIREKIKEVSDRTLSKIKEMDEDIANSLNPVIPKDKDLKWQDVFKNVSITGDENIPINKRGSGVRRLILLNFFRAEAERRAVHNENANIIYAIEEPETSQHTNNQFKLIEALKNLSELDKTQIIITTHSPNIVKSLEYSNLRLIKNNDAIKTIEPVEPGKLKYPSLNEVNYVAFGEVTEEYHNELYGYIEFRKWLNDYKSGKKTMAYKKQSKNRDIIDSQLILTEYIRHQIHHPENKLNIRFTRDELGTSIEMMRKFIESKSSSTLTK
ncbi:ATP-binding protein [Veillonella sp. CHU110]|uniref:ATP-binding protein n=1 Tax=Veillonella sp. CHU110 TaxID=2490947 RepID=UPI000F8E206B|nr:ATP-binding protein [Veillonella sp. CHU110]